MQLSLLSALLLALFAAQPAAAQDEITRHDVISNWSLFEDDGYCWMATNTRRAGGQRLLLTVDLEGSVALFIDMDGISFVEGVDHLMFLGSRKVLFRSRGDWAWTYRDSPERFLETILESSDIRYEIIVSDNGARRTVIGTWETQDAERAFTTLRARCRS